MVSEAEWMYAVVTRSVKMMNALNIHDSREESLITSSQT